MFLIDTNVLSELRRRRPDPRVIAWRERTDPAAVLTSVLVVGEIAGGIEGLRRRDAAAAASYERWLDELLDAFGGRILPVSVDVARAWGLLCAARPLPVVDGLLAATALVHGLTLVTRNTADVAGTGVPVLDPFA